MIVLKILNGSHYKEENSLAIEFHPDIYGI